MAGRTRILLLLMIVFAPAAFARVLSYAPYTNRNSISSTNLREGRWFALAEAASTIPGGEAQVVLYDARGIEEPRIIYPEPASTKPVSFVAVWEWHFANILPVPNEPWILIGSGESVPNYTPYYLLSRDGGRTFTRVKDLDNAFLSAPPEVRDYGGPYSHGLTNPVFVGDQFRFVLSTSKGIFAIDMNGAVKPLAPFGYQLLGRDSYGSRFLVREIVSTDVSILDADGRLTKIGGIPPGWLMNGWITADGSAYLNTMSGVTRELYFYRNGQMTRISGSLPPTGPPGSDLTFFAVPTSDFNGAWMIQRQSGKPTTLSRHTQASGGETFWSDVSGPEVEAIHTGTAPDRLLIQVHRPRVQSERWLLDPALALWRVGDPAPRGYDELFLNETFSKGFIHLDVDSAGEGTPFVFDSGSVQANICVICSPGGGGGGGGGADVTQEWGVVRASLKQRLVLPGIARQPGAFGSYWLTDVVVHNPLDSVQYADFRFVPLGSDAVVVSSARQIRLAFAPKEIRVLRDVMKTLFDLDQGGGVLYIDPSSAVTATARTYTRSGEGSLGFGMQAIDSMNAAGPRFPITFAGAFPGTEYRTNMLLTDTSGRGAEARLRGHGLSGFIGADDIAFHAPDNGAQQMNGIAGALGLTATDAGGLELIPTRGTLIATVVAIDNRTNDPTFFPPDLPAPVVRTIPVVGHLDGANNSKFRSDLYLLNTSATSSRTVQLEAKPWDSQTVIRRAFTLLPGEARVVRDVLPTLFSLTGVARLRFSSSDTLGNDGVRVTSRTYNVDENGGTFGCLVPPLNAFQSAGPGETLEILGITGGSGFRTNLGFVELTPGANGTNAQARIRVADESGKEIDQFAITFPIAGGMQINDLFASRGIPVPAAAIIYVEVTRGLIGAYATLTDNVTNDATYLGASLGAQPN